MLKRTRIIFLSTILVMTLLVYASAGSLGITRSEQQKSNWCWAACAKMIGNYYGKTITQSNIVEYVKGDYNNNDVANMYEANSALIYASDMSTEFDGVLSLSEVKREIDDGDPIEIRIGWDGGTLMRGHFLVVGGYRISSIRIIDPATSSSGSKYFTYSALINGADLDSGSNACWTHSIVIL